MIYHRFENKLKTIPSSELIIMNCAALPRPTKQALNDIVIKQNAAGIYQTTIPSVLQKIIRITVCPDQGQFAFFTRSRVTMLHT